VNTFFLTVLMAVASGLVIVLMAMEWGMVRYTTTKHSTAIASFWVDKCRKQAAESGHSQAAKNLRKQGVPLEVALLILFK